MDFHSLMLMLTKNVNNQGLSRLRVFHMFQYFTFDKIDQIIVSAAEHADFRTPWLMAAAIRIEINMSEFFEK